MICFSWSSAEVQRNEPGLCIYLCLHFLCHRVCVRRARREKWMIYKDWWSAEPRLKQPSTGEENIIRCRKTAPPPLPRRLFILGDCFADRQINVHQNVCVGMLINCSSKFLSAVLETSLTRSWSQTLTLSLFHFISSYIKPFIFFIKAAREAWLPRFGILYSSILFSHDAPWVHLDLVLVLDLTQLNGFGPNISSNFVAWTHGNFDWISVQMSRLLAKQQSCDWLSSSQ